MTNPPKVTLAWIHPADVSHEWAKRLRHLRLYDLATRGYSNHPHGEMASRCSEGAPSDSRADARNFVVRDWLDQSDAEWLLWIDCDMLVERTLIDQFLAVADPETHPIVGALCFGLVGNGQSQSFGMSRTLLAPTLYHLGGKSNPFLVQHDYPRDQMVEVDATGGAVIIIHRSVMEAIREKYGDIWYKQAPNPIHPRMLGEDVSFCLRARECGFPIHVDTRIKTSHDKHGIMFLDEELYLTQQRRLVPPPATEMVDVIVPVLHRPQNVKPFMESLRASTGLATPWFVIEEDDEEEAEEINRRGGNYLRKSGTFAQKVNHVILAGSGRWVFLCGDDVVFRPGWLDYALATARETGAKVVGTNDLANRRVLTGQHATHMLIRRDYIEEIGASWDGPGIVCHEGYRHWFVDDEIVTAAKQRGVWAPCLNSVVEHMHPIAGKAEMDEVYELGSSEAEADKRRFMRRSLTYAP